MSVAECISGVKAIHPKVNFLEGSWGSRGRMGRPLITKQGCRFDPDLLLSTCTLRGSSLLSVCDCVHKWMNRRQKTCTALCIKALYKCSHVPFVLLVTTKMLPTTNYFYSNSTEQHKSRGIWSFQFWFGPLSYMVLYQIWFLAGRPQSEQSYWNSYDLYITLEQHSSQFCTGCHLEKTDMEDSCDGGSQWRDSEVFDLINIWGGTAVKAKHEGSYCNRSVFENIA